LQLVWNKKRNDTKVISTRHGKIKTPFSQRAAGLSFLRFAWLLIGLSLPAAGPSAVASVTTFGSEAEAGCEELMGFAEIGRLRKSRSCQPRWSGYQISSAQRTIISARQHSGHRIDGHRIRNGLRAPMRC
jgi:hypothetical protein